MKKVLVVDDSALVRKQLRELITQMGFEVDIAKNGAEAVEKARSTNFDLITMDVNMPVMDGLTAVKKIMAVNPTPILMVSSLTSEDAPTTIQAIEYGAVDYVAKPGTFNVGLADNGQDLQDKITSLARMSRQKLERMLASKNRRVTKEVHEPIVSKKRSSSEINKVLLIGASTGGPGLIDDICSSIPGDYNLPVFVVQHMPAKFTEAFATRLARVSNLPVVEAANNEEVSPGCIYIAKGGVHLHFAKKVSGKIVMRLEEERGASFFQPSVDEMMLSAVETFDAKNIIGVLLTGIGDDGADGMVEIKRRGGYTLGESEASSTVYGMPREAFERGGVSEQLDFQDILRKLVALK
ncbi:MAG: chemotaxis-specific protein-glutamate methyltransferase CheB [Thiovulaceae bacterium]|nr:chemotaxis-specific protein-glutamate methyltransferase CheB [Sulfurimonadaceae bacterium]